MNDPFNLQAPKDYPERFVRPQADFIILDRKPVSARATNDNRLNEDPLGGPVGLIIMALCAALIGLCLAVTI